MSRLYSVCQVMSRTVGCPGKLIVKRSVLLTYSIHSAAASGPDMSSVNAGTSGISRMTSPPIRRLQDRLSGSQAADVTPVEDAATAARARSGNYCRRSPKFQKETGSLTEKGGSSEV